MRATLATLNEISGAKRKLAWFALHGRGLYFEVCGSLSGSHTSYHVDGNVFRTSPATGAKPRFQGKMLPLEQFVGWHQLGIVMIDRSRLAQCPTLKPRDTRNGNAVEYISTTNLPASCLNIVIELVHHDSHDLLNGLNLDPPASAIQYALSLGRFDALLTVFGHDSDLLIRPNETGVTVTHFNNRFTANAEGVTYTFEAYR